MFDIYSGETDAAARIGALIGNVLSVFFYVAVLWLAVYPLWR